MLMLIAPPVLAAGWSFIYLLFGGGLGGAVPRRRISAKRPVNWAVALLGPREVLGCPDLLVGRPLSLSEERGSCQDLS